MRRRLWLLPVAGLIFLTVFPAFFYAAAYRDPGAGREVALTPAEITGLEDMIKALEESLAISQKKIDDLAGQMKSTERQIEQAKIEMADAEARLEESVRHFSTRVRSAYIRGPVFYLELLLEADNFGDLIVRTAYLRRIAARDSNLIALIKHERELIRKRQETIDEQHRRLQALLAEAEAEHGRMLSQRKEKMKLLDEAVKKTAGFKPVYGIVIDNHPNARPQAGLAEATMIYEYEVEGGTTRLLALFSVFPAKVGPIRSARTHSIMLALENNVHYIYAGGTADVRETIALWGLRHTNALLAGRSAIYRDGAGYAPHNLYVNLAALKEEAPSRIVLVRPASLERKGSPASTVSLDYGPHNRIVYSYRPDTRDYRRYLNGQPFRDASGKPVIARNIVIQYVPHALDSYRRPTPNLIGSGAIDFFSQGQRFRGTWKKDSPGSPTHFYYLDGQPIEMVFGQTWIQIVRSR